MTNTEPEDPEGARALVAHSLCQYVPLIEASRVAPAMSLVIPMLMARSTAEGEDVYTETGARLLGLAAANQEVFKAIVGGMSVAQRGFLEEVIRYGRQERADKDNTDSEDAGQPTIALKMNFGG